MSLQLDDPENETLERLHLHEGSYRIAAALGRDDHFEFGGERFQLSEIFAPVPGAQT